MITRESFDIHSIPIEVMLNQIRVISFNLKHNQYLYGESTYEQAINIYSLAQLSKIVLVKNTIIAIIKIPMITDKNYKCSKITPIIFTQKATTRIRTIQGQYVLLNEETGQYCMKTELEISKCMQLNDNKLCEFEKIFTKNATNKCELDIVLNKQNNTCTTTKYTADLFLEKIKPFTWLYGTKQSIVYIECENESYMIPINGSGLLTINSKCTAKINNAIIRGLEHETNDISLSTEQWHTISLEVASSPNDSLKKLEAAMNDLKEETEIHRFFHIHHTTILYMFISWIIICITIMFWRNKRDRDNQPGMTANVI